MAEEQINIDLSKEKNNIFSARVRYDIIADAIEAAYDDGFMNEFIFPRVVLLGITAQYFEDDFEYDKKSFDSPREAIKAMPLEIWDTNLQNDLLIKIVNTIPQEINDILLISNHWFEDYKEYAYSLRGLMDNIGPFMQGITQQANDDLNSMLQNGELREAINIGKDWGLQTPGQSLFKDAGELEDNAPLIM